MAQKILLADDSMTAQNMGKKILSDAGYEVIAVSNGAAAVKKIAEHKPDLAVLDVYMPGYTGLEVCERVKNALETSKMPVLLSVGKMEPFKAEEGNRVKADGLLVKPFEATDLLAAVQKLLNKMKAPTGTVMITPGDPHASAGYAATVLVQAPDFKNASHESWKSQEAKPVEQSQPASENPVSFPTAMQESPALGMDHFDNASAHRPTAMMPAPTRALAPKEISRAAPGKISAPIPESAEETIRSKPAVPAPDFSRGWFGAAAVGDADTATPDSENPDALETLAPISAIPSSDDRAPAPDAAATKPDPGQASPEETAHFEAAPIYGAASSSPADEITAAPAKAMAAIPHFEPDSSHVTRGFGQDNAISGVGTDVPHDVDPNLEVTSPRLAREPEAETVTDLGPTTPKAAENDASVTPDPGLMTDASEMAAAFPTRFGVPGAEPMAVGMAADLPELYAEAEKAVSHAADTSEGPPVWEAEDVSEADPGWTQAAGGEEAASDKDGPQVYEVEETPVASAEPPAAWKAFETSLNIHEKSLSLHQEMQRQSAKANPSAEAAGQAPVEGAAELSKAMAAAVGAEMAPAIAQAASETRAENPSFDAAHHESLIADIVHRVTERMKPHLAAEIARELASELTKKKK